MAARLMLYVSPGFVLRHDLPIFGVLDFDVVPTIACLRLNGHGEIALTNVVWQYLVGTVFAFCRH
jgi:hypothetical protein